DDSPSKDAGEREMTTDTNQLIRELAEHVGPVRRVPGPGVRALMWFAVSLTYIALFVVLMPVRHDDLSNPRNYLFVIEQAGALAPGPTAAIAAFGSVVPGYDRNWTLLPVIPFAVWLASLGPGCVREWNEFGIAQLPLSHNHWCVPFIVLFGSLPVAM